MTQSHPRGLQVSAAEVSTESFGYRSPTDTTTSGQVSTHAITGGINKTYSYTYDDNGNILTISDGTKTTSYVYDSANQLIRENNEAGNFTHVWAYDSAGNILSRTEYAYTTGELGAPTDTVTYVYGNSDWGDLLTSYDGQTITSDTIGNMLTDGTWTYTWKQGRQLATMSDGTTTWTYTYNADGLRTKRTNGTDTYTYVYNGTQLTQMKYNNDTLYFTYDAAGTPLTVTWNSALYYYVTNAQGDVIHILDDTGRDVATYIYTAWGEVQLYAVDGIVDINPLRYRGYVYDTETGLYYLQSRYYDPEIGRFINADAFVSTGQGFIGNNMFVYSNNNPGNMTDTTGQLPIRNTMLMMSDGGSIGMFRSNESIKRMFFCKKIPRAVEAICNNVEASVGIGLGLLAEANVSDVIGLGMGLNYNLVEAKLDHGTISVEQSYSMGVDASVLFMDVLQDANESGSRKLSFSAPLDDFTMDDYNRNWTILSAKAYFIAGGSVYIGFDMISFCEEIDAIFFDK